MNALHRASSVPPVQLGRRLVLVGLGSLALGCFGSFGAVRKLWAWNETLGDKWVKWLVFLGLSIIPVYELFVLADTLVLNSVEFWSGRNPVLSSRDGRTVTRVATADPELIRLEIRRDGRLEQVYFLRRLEAGLQLLDRQGVLQTSVRERHDGSVELRGSREQLLALLDPAAAERAYASVAEGLPARLALARELAPVASATG